LPFWSSKPGKPPQLGSATSLPQVQPPTPSLASTRPWYDGWGTRRKVLASLFTALALFGSGLASGWWLQNELVARQESSTAARPDDGTLDDFAADIASGAMPDLRGLGSDASKQILADSGIPVDRVEVTTRAAAGRPGIVIEQTPPFGSSDTAKVTLVVSTSAQVPVIENRSATEVISELQELGAQVIVKSRYQPDAVRDGALDVDPPVGAPIPDAVTLTVAQSPGSAYLSKLDAMESGCGTGSESMDGKKYENSVTCTANKPGTAKPRKSVWNLAHAVDEMRATVGVPTDSMPGTRVRVEVFADGTPVAAVDAGYGQPADLYARVSGALQLTVVATALTDSGSSRDTEAVLADPTILGSQQAIVDLTEDN